MLNGPAGLAGASAMHGYSIRMALVRFRMMIVCKRVLYEKVVYFQRESCQGEGSGRRLSKQEECTESEYMVLRSALYSVYVKDCWLHKKGEGYRRRIAKQINNASFCLFIRRCCVKPCNTEPALRYPQCLPQSSEPNV